MVEKRRGHRKEKFRQEPASPNPEAGEVLVQLILASQDAASVRRIAEINGITPQEFLTEAMTRIIYSPSLVDADEGGDSSIRAFPDVYERFEKEQAGQDHIIEEGSIIHLASRRNTPR